MTTRKPSSLSRTEPLDTMDALVQLSFRIQRVLSETGAKHDVSIIQIRLLGVLRDRQAGMVELGRHLGLDKSSMTGLVSRAEKRGFVKRVASTDDGRAVVVSLTPAGKKLTDRCTAQIGDRISELTEALTPNQRAQITKLATKLVWA